jgi:hypothetical protein
MNSIFSLLTHVIPEIVTGKYSIDTRYTGPKHYTQDSVRIQIEELRMIVKGTVISNYADTELCYAQLARQLRRPVTTDTPSKPPTTVQDRTIEGLL